MKKDLKTLEAHMNYKTTKILKDEKIKKQHRYKSMFLYL